MRPDITLVDLTAAEKQNCIPFGDTTGAALLILPDLTQMTKLGRSGWWSADIVQTRDTQISSKKTFYLEAPVTRLHNTPRRVLGRTQNNKKVRTYPLVCVPRILLTCLGVCGLLLDLPGSSRYYRRKA